MSLFRKPLVFLAALVLSLSLSPVNSHASNHSHEEFQPHIPTYEYSYKVMHGLIQSMKKETRGPLPLTEAVKRIEQMSHVEAMDTYLASKGKKVSTKEIKWIVQEIYDIDLQLASDLGAGKEVGMYPEEVIQAVREAVCDKKFSGDVEDYLRTLSKVEVMDLYIEAKKREVSGPEIRRFINQVFGINLDGLSALEEAGISLFSKGQWMLQADDDLFAIYTGLTDVDVKVVPTDYFTAQTGLTELPDSLKKALSKLGYQYNERVGAFYYANPTGESVPDAFKGQTLGTIVQVIQKYYPNL